MEDRIMAYMRMAQQAKQRAYAPYSQFRVGAVAVDAQGHAYPGCNIENAAYSCCMCAERTALYSAIAQGAKRIEAIYLTSDSATRTFPCGVCRQVLMEHNPNMLIYAASEQIEDVQRYALCDLLPHAFVSSSLNVQE